MGAASDGGGQLPLGALTAAVQDEVCAGPGGHGRLRLGALGLGLLLLLCGWTAPGEARPACSASPLHFSGPTFMAPPPPPGPAPDPASIARSRPRPRPELTQGAPGALRPEPLVAALLHKTDAVAPIGVLAEALP